jgi:putative tricarboxylic transport membrane protein
MKINDAIVGAALIALAIAILLHIQSYPLIPGQKYGPALFPGLIAAGFIATGALLIVRGVRGVRAGLPLVQVSAWLRSPRQVANFAAVCAALVFYVVAAQPLGFIPTGALLLAGLFLQFRVPPLRAVVTAVVATLVIHLLFYKLLRVPLPWGLLERFAW